jgi:dynein heavy chain
MNSLLDDSKLLTLNNGERMPLAPNCKLTFEVNDLNAASPATISRVGLIYMDVAELGYQPILNVWVQNKSKVDVGLKGDEYRDHLQSLVTLYVYKMCKTKNSNCKELVASSETANIRNFCHLYDAVFGNSKKTPEEDAENFKCYITRIFVFALIWSIGATIQE